MIGDESETLQKTHSMNRHFTSQSGRTWLVALLMTSTPLVFALIRGMWFAPYPISETVALMDLAGVMDRSALPAGSWFDPRLQAFGIRPRTPDSCPRM